MPDDIKSIAEKIITLPNIASKKWIYDQYDSMVGTANLNTNGPSDASVVAIKETSKALALTTDCNSRYVFANPYIGCMIAVSEAARNIVCSGGYHWELPIASTLAILTTLKYITSLLKV